MPYLSRTLIANLLRKWMPSRATLPRSAVEAWPPVREVRAGKYQARLRVRCGPPDRCFYARVLGVLSFERALFLRTFSRSLLTEDAVQRLKTRLQINLPDIESVYELGVEQGEGEGEGEAYIASECIAGASLADLAVALERRHQRLPWPLALALFHQARSLLVQVHQSANMSPVLRPTSIRLSTEGRVTLCWGLNLAPSSPLGDEVALARFVFALAAPERPGLVEGALAGDDRASLSVLSDLIAEAEPALASAASLVLWSQKHEEASEAIAEHVKEADVIWLWQCVAPFFPPLGWTFD